MITMKDNDIDGVKISYNPDEKSAKCKCGHSWVPVSALDYICAKCKGKE